MALKTTTNKLYYSITEVGDMLNVKPSLLRFWEKEFKQIQPKTNARGKRLYKQEDIDIVRRIYDLVKVQGLTLEGARKAMVARKGEAKTRGLQAAIAAKEAQTQSAQSALDFGTDDREEAIQKLKRIRQKLLEARAAIQG